MKTNTLKLALNRETLVALQPDTLSDVVGGNASAPGTTSRIGGCPSRILDMCITRPPGCPDSRTTR